MTSRFRAPSRRLLLIAPVCALALAGCASAAQHTAQQAASNPQASSPAPSPTPTTAAALLSLSKQAMTTVSSVLLTVTINAQGQSIVGHGAERMSNGKATAVTLAETVPGVGEIGIIMAGGKFYLRLPQGTRPANTKPWYSLDPASSNPAFAQLLQSAQQMGTSMTDQYMQAVTSLSLVGTDTVGGVPATHYRMVVDPLAAPLSSAIRTQLQQSGIKTIPMEMWFDSSYRPIKAVVNVTAQGVAVDTTTTFGEYNAPVTIAAPPASQVQPAPANLGNG